MSNEKFTLHQVQSAKDVKEFHKLAKRIYKGNKNWVCPIESDIEKIFNPEKNQLFNGGEAIRWIVKNSSGEVVGRIAAFYNNEKAAIEDQSTGGCGFYESIDNQEVANLLFDASREWLKQRGMEAMDGPVNFGQRDTWWGLLVEGYDYQPLYENPYNPPYYKPLFESYGFQNYFNQHTYLWKIEGGEINEKVYDRAKRLIATPGYTFNTINMDDLEGEAEKFRTIYNKAWAVFPGVKLMEREEAIKIMNTMKPIIDPEIIFFAYFEGVPIGFFIMIPDLNRVVYKFDGKLGWWEKIRLMWDLKVTRSCDRIFGLIFAVSPEYRGKGVESAIMQTAMDEYLTTPKNKYKTLELAWIGDFNPVMCRMVETYVGAVKHKMHTTYRYLFDRTLEFKRCPRMGVKKPE
ncbi:MAG: hypothetical protein SNG35_07005 [Rikenellaceae bacterium]